MRDMRTTSAPFKYYADWTERIAKGVLPHSNLVWSNNLNSPLLNRLQVQRCVLLALHSALL